MSTTKAPQTQPLPHRNSAVVPPPPSESILQKTSSFSNKNRDGTTTAKSGTSPQAGTKPQAPAQQTQPKPQAPQQQQQQQQQQGAVPTQARGPTPQSKPNGINNAIRGGANAVMPPPQQQQQPQPSMMTNQSLTPIQGMARTPAVTPQQPMRQQGPPLQSPSMANREPQSRVSQMAPPQQQQMPQNMGGSAYQGGFAMTGGVPGGANPYGSTMNMMQQYPSTLTTGSIQGGSAYNNPNGFSGYNNGSLYNPTNSFYNRQGPGSIATGGSQMQPQYSLGQQGFGSMGQGQFSSMRQSSLYGTDGAGMDGMGGMSGGMSSLYGPMGGSMYSNGALSNGMNSMYQPVGSMYGMMHPSVSAYGFAAQWASLGNINGDAGMGGANRSTLTSDYGGFKESSEIRTEDLCPNIGSWEDAKEVKRSGKRGGNHLYVRDKSDKSAPVVSSNAYGATISIKKKKKDNQDDDKSRPTPRETLAKSATAAAAPATTTGASSSTQARTAGTSASADNKPRAKVPSNYNVHSLLLVDKAKGEPLVAVKDPALVIYEKDGKKETFTCDEAIARAKPSEEIDSVLLSELRANWFNGHNSALLVTAGAKKMKDSYDVARAFLKKCVDRLEKNEKSNGTKFEISITMCSIRGSDRGLDLLSSDAEYGRLNLGSSPVYGPCLMGLETKYSKNTESCLEAFNEGIKNAADEKEIITCFFVLKQTKKGSEVEVHLSSLCVAFMREQPSHLVDLKEKAASSPYKLFRYAIGGSCITVSVLCVSEDDAKARDVLESQRKIREVVNKPPRSGNVSRFIQFTEKETDRVKEKSANVTGSEKTMREAQIKRMQDMVADAQAILSDPENTKPKGYLMGEA